MHSGRLVSAALRASARSQPLTVLHIASRRRKNSKEYDNSLYPKDKVRLQCARKSPRDELDRTLRGLLRAASRNRLRDGLRAPEHERHLRLPGVEPRSERLHTRRPTAQRGHDRRAEGDAARTIIT